MSSVPSICLNFVLCYWNTNLKTVAGRILLAKARTFTFSFATTEAAWKEASFSNTKRQWFKSQPFCLDTIWNPSGDKSSRMIKLFGFVVAYIKLGAKVLFPKTKPQKNKTKYNRAIIISCIDNDW